MDFTYQIIPNSNYGAADSSDFMYEDTIPDNMFSKLPAKETKEISTKATVKISRKNLRAIL